ncbi:MAG: FAD-dependent oxidoreductase [Bacteroidota bacterium]
MKALNTLPVTFSGLFFKDGTTTFLKAIYTRTAFRQHSSIPEALGCELTQDGYINIDSAHRTTVHCVFACGDNVSRLRTVSNAVAMGTIAGHDDKQRNYNGTILNQKL